MSRKAKLIEVMGDYRVAKVCPDKHINDTHNIVGCCPQCGSTNLVDIVASPIMLQYDDYDPQDAAEVSTPIFTGRWKVKE